MDIPTGERRQDSSEWLRTGRILRNGVELKFNPYHDPANGRFTTAGGSWMGGDFTRGGGGSFGGGGATGSWGATEKRPKARAPVQGNTPTFRPAVPRTSAAIATAPIAQQLLQPAPNLRRVVRNGYEYRIDPEDRTISVSGTLTLSGSQLRSGKVQAQAGGTDRRPKTDDGGHYIAARFNGPTDAFNHFAQDAKFNRGGYRVLEDKVGEGNEGGAAGIGADHPIL